MSTSTNRVTAVTTSLPSGSRASIGTTITFTLVTEAHVTVTGSPQLTLSNGALATYAGTDASGEPIFSYVVARGDDTADLKVTGLVLNGGAVTSPGQLSFAPKQDFATGLGPTSIATGDFNGDGKLDLVTVNDGENNLVWMGSGLLPALSVLLGNGDGTFAARQDYPVARFPGAVITADVNGDGKLDLITPDGDNSAVSVLLGNGDGTFGPRRNFPTGYDASSIAAGDVNGDGKLDLVTADTSTVSVLLGNGDGTFPTRLVVATVQYPPSVIAADVNGDGKLDLIVANQLNDAVAVLLGQGDGTFARRDFGTGHYPRSVSAADVNGDGKLDLITGGDSGLSLLVGNGDGTFAASQALAGSYPSRSVTTADVNGDGKLDLLSVGYNNDAVSVLLGNGNGTFAAPQVFATGRSPSSVTAGDVNGDGMLDVIVPDYDGNAVSVLRNASVAPATFDATSIPTSAGADTGIVVDTSGAPATVFGPLAFRLAAFGLDQGWTSDNAFPREMGDVNGDGAADIIGFGGAGVYVALNAGDGSFGTASFASASFALNAGGWVSQDRHPRHVADVNGDGRADIVGFANDGTYVSLGDGHGGFGPMTFRGASFGANQGWTSNDALPRVLGDVNGDGRADIVGFGESAIFVELGQADGSLGAPVVSQIGLVRSSGWVSDNTYHRELADVNGDGRSDIVAFGEAGVFVAMSNGDGSFGGAVFEFADFGRKTWSTENQLPRHAADVNGDGKADIVGFGTDRIWLALGNGDGSFQAMRDDAVEFTSRAGGWTSDDTYPRLLADINHDGTADIVGFGGAGVYTALASDYHLV